MTNPNRITVAAGDPLVTEDGDFIVWSIEPISTGDANRVLTETGRPLLISAGCHLIYTRRTVSDRSHITESDAPVIYAVMLVDLDTPDGIIRVSNSNKKLDVQGLEYLPFGAVLSIRPVEETVGLESRRVTLTVSRASEELQSAALETGLPDRDIRIRLAMSTDGSNFDDNIVNLQLGKVSQVSVTKDSVVIEMYTPMGDSHRSIGLAKRWSDEQQRKYIAEDDLFFRFTAQTSRSEIRL